MSDTLTVGDVHALAELVSAVNQTAKVAYIGIDGQSIYGHARYFCGNGDGGGIPAGMDIRQCYVRVTLRSGFESFPTVQYLSDAVKRGEFSIYDW